MVEDEIKKKKQEHLMRIFQKQQERLEEQQIKPQDRLQVIVREQERFK